MNLRTAALSILVLALTTPAFAADKSPMKPGKWEITMQMDMPGMPMKMPPMKVTNCVTKEQAENPEPPKAKNGDDCKISDYKRDGNTVSWSMECKKQNMKGEGSITFSDNGESYEGIAHLKMGDMDMSQKYSGKYVGECDK